MAKLSLSMNGELNIEGEFITDPNIIFSLNEFGDLITKSLTVIEEPNPDNPNLLMSFNTNGITLYGVADKATPPEPKPNLVDVAGGFLVNEYAEIIEETEEYYIVECEWEGSGLTFPIALEGNKQYRYVIDIEIISAPLNGRIGFGIFNLSAGDYVHEVVVTSSDIGIVQKLVGTFETISNIQEGDLLEIDALARGTEHNILTYKLYKNLSVTEV